MIGLFNPREQARLASKNFSPIDIACSGINNKTPWDSIVDFATHKSYCGFPLFPRQATLLKLMFLETENMTQFDLDVIEEWRHNFVFGGNVVYGVQPDIWQRVEYLKQRGYRRFRHIMMVLGRRGSKGAMGGIVGCEQLAYVHSKDNPQKHYGIAEGKDVYMNVGATSQTQAARQLFADIRTMVENCQYFYPDGQPSWIAESKDAIMRIRTPADLRRIAKLQADGAPIDHQIASLVATALGTNSASGRGQTSFANFYDEFAFHVQTGSSKSDSEIYAAWQPSLGQFGIDALTYIPSSPFTKAGQFYVLYEQSKKLMSSYNDETGMTAGATQNLINVGVEAELDADPTQLVFQAPSWELYRDWKEGRRIFAAAGVKQWWKFPKAPEPDMDDERQIREQRANPDKFRVEKQGQFAEVEGQYLDSRKVDRMFEEPGWRDPLEPVAMGVFSRKYRIHCDPGRTGANFSLAIAHLEDAPPDEHGIVWPHVVFDYLKVWRPKDFPPDPETKKPTIDYVQVSKDIDDILGRFMSTDRISFDQWNSASFIASLKQKFMPAIRVSEVTFTDKENQVRCEKFKSILNLGWVHSYRDNFYHDNLSCLLELELKFLSEKNGKVIKQETGPVTTKDLADAVMVVTVDLLRDALDRWSSERLTAGAFGSTDSRGLKSGREQERLDSGMPRDNKAWRQLDNNKQARVANRRRGGHEQSRLSSIHTRQPKTPTAFSK